MVNKNDFPIFKNNPDLVYLDNAATSQKPYAVINAVKKFYEQSNANVHRGIFKLSENATSLYESARNIVAEFINADPQEVVFTSGTTASINAIAIGLTDSDLLSTKKNVVLATEMEHHSNLIPWQLYAKNSQKYFDLIKVNSDFKLDIKQLEKLLQNNTVEVVALTHMSNTLGTINPIEDIVKLVRKNSPKTLIVLDAAQSAPHLKIDVKILDVDYLVFSGHKMFGPTGIGVLWGKRSVLEALEPVFTGGGMIEKVGRKESKWAEIPHKFEAGTPNIAGVIGLAAAIEYIKNIGTINIEKYERELAEYTISKLQNIKNLTLYGPVSPEQRGNVFSFNYMGIHAHDLSQLLDEQNIAVRAGHHCNQVLMRDVLKVIATSRASLYIYNTKEDIDKLVDGLYKIGKDFLK